MGLDMYLYKSTKTRFDTRNKYRKAMDEHWHKWSPLIGNLPRKDNGWEIDKEKLTPADLKIIEDSQREEDEIKAKLNYTNDSDKEIHYWRKFNALHGFIVREFADGVDECQIIEIGGKEGVKKILDALKKTKEQIESGSTEELAMPPTPGFFFGPTDVDDWFKEDLNESIPFFEDLHNNLEDDEVIYYEASW